MFKGNEKDCICDKANGKHKKHCDAYRFSNFLKSLISNMKDHTCCFEQENPPCGMKGKHRCCLCGVNYINK